MGPLSRPRALHRRLAENVHVRTVSALTQGSQRTCSEDQLPPAAAYGITRLMIARGCGPHAYTVADGAAAHATQHESTSK
jgi:hypothetical protein